MKGGLGVEPLPLANSTVCYLGTLRSSQWQAGPSCSLILESYAVMLFIPVIYLHKSFHVLHYQVGSYVCLSMDCYPIDVTVSVASERESRQPSTSVVLRLPVQQGLTIIAGETEPG
jgi:hypothetical protein